MAERSDLEESYKPAGSDSKGTILIVEDEELVRRVAKRILTRTGYTVLEAANGTEAANVVKTEQGGIDLLLVDLNLKPSGENGEKVAGDLKNLCPDMKTLLLSGEYLEENRYSTKIDGFLQKPFTLDALAGTVNNILGYDKL